jgi:hypothetical protein
MVARVCDDEQVERRVDCSIVAEKVERTGEAKFLLLLTKVQPEEDLQIEDRDAADDDDDDGAFLLTCL